MDKRAELAALGLQNLGEIYANLAPAVLVEQALNRGEGVLCSNGALSVLTGKYTGRSPKDRYIVAAGDHHANVDWGKENKELSEESFAKLRRRQMAYLKGRDVFVFEGFIGADTSCRMAVRVINEYAWQALCVNQLLIRPTAAELADFEPQCTVIATPGLKAVPAEDGTASEAFIVLNLQEKQVLIGASSYAGEIKKSCFSMMNYFMPGCGVCPMHCSANVGGDGRTALFFGLSGTGKTTLSADPLRRLIGDDEHGWSDGGIFNFEGGCYAKCINLSEENEPQIWNAIRFGSVLENVVLDKETRDPDYSDAFYTENTRSAYPIHYIPQAELSGRGEHPSAIIFLTADAFGVLPPVAKLDKNQASYHFLSGYTSKLAGTERGITEPQATFSTCFGAPFMLRSAGVYAGLLRDRIEKHQPDVYLLNTGWVGGSYGVGHRMSLPYTRAIVTAALNGSLRDVPSVQDPVFGFSVPQSCPGVPSELLNPKNTWQDKEAYDKTAAMLADLFKKNIRTLKAVAPEILAAGPY